MPEEGRPVRLRNDTDEPLHIPTDPGALVEPGAEIEWPTYVTGLTPLDHEHVDGEWRPITEPEPAPRAAAGKPGKIPPAPTAEEVTP